MVYANDSYSKTANFDHFQACIGKKNKIFLEYGENLAIRMQNVNITDVFSMSSFVTTSRRVHKDWSIMKDTSKNCYSFPIYLKF